MLLFFARFFMDIFIKYYRSERVQIVTKKDVLFAINLLKRDIPFRLKGSLYVGAIFFNLIDCFSKENKFGFYLFSQKFNVDGLVSEFDLMSFRNMISD